MSRDLFPSRELTCNSVQVEPVIASRAGPLVAYQSYYVLVLKAATRTSSHTGS